MRSPFTSIVFALELTHDVAALLPLLVACTVAHLRQRPDAEALDPHREDRPPRLPRHPRVRGRPAAGAARPRRDGNRRADRRSPRRPPRQLYERLPEGCAERRQRLYPVSTSDERLVGVLAFSDVLAARRTHEPAARQRAGARARRRLRPTRRCATSPTAWSPADHGVLPVVDREDPPAPARRWSASSTCSRPTSAC